MILFITRHSNLIQQICQNNVALFFTRWITHYCAPIFVFLAGTGAYLQLARGKSKSELSRFLLTRGLWLIVLEFTVVRFGFTFNFDYRFLGAMQVIWAIGVSMIILSALIHLPIKLIAAIGLTMILPQPARSFYSSIVAWAGLSCAWIWCHVMDMSMTLSVRCLYLVSPDRSPSSFTLLIPWIGVMAAGYSFGVLYQMTLERRRKLLLTFGIVATLLFCYLAALISMAIQSAGRAKELPFHHSFFFEYHQIFAFSSVFTHDTGSSNV